MILCEGTTEAADAPEAEVMGRACEAFGDVLDNPWCVAIVGGVAAAVLTYIALYYLFGRRKQKRALGILMVSLDNADRLLEKDTLEMTRTALTMYQKVLEAVSKRYESDLYGRIKNSEGICYSRLALVDNKEANLTLAIRAYEEALEIHTLEKCAAAYAMIQNNLGNAYLRLAEVRDKEANLARAVAACEQALRIYTVERFPVDYAMTQNNRGNAYLRLAEVRDKEANLKRAVTAYEQALRIYTLGKYPLYHDLVMRGLTKAKQAMGE